MKSRQRTLTALDHQEPDRVPIDLGGTVVSSIAISTYGALRDYLGMAALEGYTELKNIYVAET